MNCRLFAIGLISATFAVGCGDSDSIQLKAGEAPPPLTEREKAQIKTEDEKVEASERANTPKAPAGKRR